MADVIDNKNRIEIELPNGYKLVAEQNGDPEYRREMYVGIVAPNGNWWQDLAVVRSAYRYREDGRLLWNDDQFEVMVYSDKDSEDFTHYFSIGLHNEAG